MCTFMYGAISCLTILVQPSCPRKTFKILEHPVVDQKPQKSRLKSSNTEVMLGLCCVDTDKRSLYSQTLEMTLISEMKK